MTQIKKYLTYLTWDQWSYPPPPFLGATKNFLEVQDWLDLKNRSPILIWALFPALFFNAGSAERKGRSTAKQKVENHRCRFHLSQTVFYKYLISSTAGKLFDHRLSGTSLRRECVGADGNFWKVLTLPPPLPNLPKPSLPPRLFNFEEDINDSEITVNSNNNKKKKH